MLTLTRRVGERITIGSSIEITVLSVSRGRVRIGIEAPRDLVVHRGELLERIAEENLRAGRSAAEAVRDAGDDAALAFPDGLLGLAEHTSFLLCELSEGNGQFRALVSRTDPNLQLLVVDACEVWPDYPVAQAHAASGIADAEVAIAAIVTAGEGASTTVNLVAPLVIGLESRRGVQVILDGGDFGARHALVARTEAPPPHLTPSMRPSEGGPGSRSLPFRAISGSKRIRAATDASDLEDESE